MMDVVLIIEVVSQIAETNFKILKTLAGRMMGDPQYLPHRDEVISLAYAMNMKKSNISKIFGFTRTTVDTVINSERNRIHVPFPQFTVKEDEEMHKFCEIFSKLKQAGI